MEVASGVAAAVGGASETTAVNRKGAIKGGADSFAAAPTEPVAPVVAQAVNSALEQHVGASKVTTLPSEIESSRCKRN